MIDRWFGKLLDSIDRQGLWEDTAVIVVSDHGHYLGERDLWGKPGAPLFEPIGHIPLMVSWPGIDPGSNSGLTTGVDIFATLADIFGITPAHTIHGESIRPLITSERKSIREWALAGTWGHEVHVIGDRWKYVRAPIGNNEPLSMWTNRWSTLSIPFSQLNFPPPDERAFLDRMPGSGIPVIRQPYQAGDMLPYWAGREFSGNYLFDLLDDAIEDHNLSGTLSEKEAEDLMIEALKSVEAPHEQLVRLGLAH